VKLIDRNHAEIGRLTLVRARATEFVESDACQIRAGDGRAVEIIEVQPEGKKPMPLAAYRNGHRWEIGLRLESIV
jgi:methionyl-tRNA formyltransferase